MNASLDQIADTARWLRHHGQNGQAARLELAHENLKIDLASIDRLEEKYEKLVKRLDYFENKIRDAVRHES